MVGQESFAASPPRGLGNTGREPISCLFPLGTQRPSSPTPPSATLQGYSPESRPPALLGPCFLAWSTMQSPRAPILTRANGGSGKMTGFLGTQPQALRPDPDAMADPSPVLGRAWRGQGLGPKSGETRFCRGNGKRNPPTTGAGQSPQISAGAPPHPTLPHPGITRGPFLLLA